MIISLTFLLFVIAVTSWYYTLRFFHLYFTLKKLNSVRDEDMTDWPIVSIIVPIHNEQTHLHDALGALCCLDYPDYEVIAIDDRSNDASASILRKLSKQFSHLKVINIKTLPNDWLGKTHALNVGSQQASGDFLIFTDADVFFAKALLKKAIAYVVKNKLGHLTLSPKLQLPTFSMKVFMPFQVVTMFLTMKPWLYDDDNPKHAIGLGAFNCVHRNALKKINYFESLALNPVDDVGLARLLKAQGVKQGLANPEELLRLSWYENLTQAFIGLEKNIFAFFDYNLGKVLVTGFAYLCFVFLPLMSLFTLSLPMQLLGLLAILPLLSCVIHTAHQFNINPSYALLYPIAALISMLIGLRAVTLCLIRGGIFWGGKFFSLAQLKRFHKQAK